MDFSLQTLTAGFSASILTVRVDRIIQRFVQRSSTYGQRPTLDLESVDIIVFDDSMNTRMMVRITSVALMDRHYWKIVEGGCYEISKFIVKEDGEGVHQFMHIEVNCAARISPVLNHQIPECLFMINLVDDCLWWRGQSNPSVIDVCGILRSSYRSANYKIKGVYTMCLILELEDSRKRYVIRYILHGEALANSEVLLQSVKQGSTPCVVLQYVQIRQSIEGGVELESFYEASRVYVEPDFPEVAEAKTRVIDV